MADPFKAVAGRAASKRSMRTSIKYDENGPYYDVNVSGGGGDAPVTAAVPARRAAVGDAPPTVLDPQRDYGPPLPPGSVGYGDEEGPTDRPGENEDDESALEEADGWDWTGTAGVTPNPAMSRPMWESAKRALQSRYGDGLNHVTPNDADLSPEYQDFARKRLSALGIDPSSAPTVDVAAALGLEPRAAEALRLMLMGGFGAGPDEEVWDEASGSDPTVGSSGLPGDVVAQEDPTLMERIRRWLGSQGADVQPASQDVSEGLNEALPRDLSGRDAVLKKRQQLKKLDEDTKDS